MENLLQMEEKLIEVLGAEKLLEELFHAMSSDEEKENLEFIARMYDIDFE